MERPVDDVIVVIGNGEMGIAVGAALASGGAKVRTSLRGRSLQSRQRTERAGFAVIDDDDELLRGADFLFSVVPPGQARAVAERFAGPLRRAAVAPVYVECNALAPATSCALGELIAGSGAMFVDASIIGPPMFDRGRSNSARIFASGAEASRLAPLGQRLGIEFVVMDGPVGAASALKMCYAGLTKGLTALGAATILSADRYHVTTALRTELSRSASGILKHLANSIPMAPRKAHRFVAEMEEIARTAASPQTGSTIYEGTATLYRYLAAEHGDGAELPSKVDKILAEFLASVKS